MEEIIFLLLSNLFFQPAFTKSLLHIITIRQYYFAIPYSDFDFNYQILRSIYLSFYNRVVCDFSGIFSRFSCALLQ